MAYFNGKKVLLNANLSSDQIIENVSWHQCPQAVRDFIDNVTYDPTDYSTTEIYDYAPNPAVQSNTKPVAETVTGDGHRNEIPNIDTPFANASMAGTLKPLDALRWINTTVGADAGVYPLGVNTRDLGGWACDGGTVKYGMLVRGGEPNPVDKAMMVDEVGIKSELYLLPISEQRSQLSAWGVDMYYNPTQDDYIWYNLTKTELWKYYLRVIFDSVTHSKPLYFHCGIGADRTGTVAVMLLALLGVSQSDIDKDYELTNFYIRQDATSPRTRNTAQYENYIAAIKVFPLEGDLSDTFRNHAVSFVLSLGFTAGEINAFRNACIDGTPTAITVTMPSYTVTNTLTHVTSDNDAVSIDKYQPYEANITPDTGYVISSVQITMGGVDITDRVWSGKETSIFRTVQNTLTHCTSDNDSIAVIAGQSFAANITADTGYTLDGATVSITMGGVDVSTQYYANGKIAIPNVTGNIAINITAVQSVVPAHNILDDVGYENGYRISKSTGEKSAQAGACLTGYIPVANGDVIRAKGFTFDGYPNCVVTLFAADKSYTGKGESALTAPVDQNYSDTGHIKISSDNVFEFTYNSVTIGTAAYIRFSATCADGANAFVTKNQELPTA